MIDKTTWEGRISGLVEKYATVGVKFTNADSYQKALELIVEYGLLHRCVSTQERVFKVSNVGRKIFEREGVKFDYV